MRCVVEGPFPHVAEQTADSLSFQVAPSRPLKLALLIFLHQPRPQRLGVHFSSPWVSHVCSSSPAKANWRPLQEAAIGIGLPKSRWSLGAFQVYSSNKTLWVDCTRATDALVGPQVRCSSTSPSVKGSEVCLAPDLWPCIPPCALNPKTQTPKPSTLNPKPWRW